jgi:hypothetical protein
MLVYIPQKFILNTIIELEGVNGIIVVSIPEVLMASVLSRKRSRKRIYDRLFLTSFLGIRQVFQQLLGA